MLLVCCLCFSLLLFCCFLWLTLMFCAFANFARTASSLRVSRPASAQRRDGYYTHTRRNTQHATSNTQHASRNTQHTTQHTQTSTQKQDTEAQKKKHKYITHHRPVSATSHWTVSILWVCLMVCCCCMHMCWVLSRTVACPYVLMYLVS